ncbi:hypothetical protein Tco_1001382, partial [Tanacetum coccineum]
FEPEANLDKEMVLHQGYLLGGSYYGHDSIFLLNCYGVRWQVEVKQTYANAMFVVGPIWSDFVSKNITQDVKCLYFIEEGEDMFYVATYNKYRLEMHGYRQKSLMFWRCLLNVIDGSRRAQTLPLVFVPKVYSTSQSDTVDHFIKDRECEVFIGKIPSVNRPKTFKLAFYGPDWWSMMDELAIRPDYNLERMGCAYQKALSTGMNYADMLQRLMESYALKFADDVLLGIFVNVPAVILVFRVTGSACSLIHPTAQIQAWGKPVWTGVDDVLLLAPVLKHVVPSLVA